jgi:hypothetical protein
VQEAVWSAEDGKKGRGLACAAPSGSGRCKSLWPPPTEPQSQITHHEHSSEKYSFVSIFDTARRDSYENLRIYPPRAQKRKINRQKDTRHNVLLNYRQIYEESLHFYYSSTMIEIALYPLHFYLKSGRLGVGLDTPRQFNAWNFILKGRFPALQTVTVEHAHFQVATRAWGMPA